MIYLSLEQVIEIHDNVISEFGGLRGIRDKGLLESAVMSPMMAAFGNELYPTVHEKAAAYMYFLVKNHPFLDGNKRTGAKTSIIFLRLNKIDVEYTPKDFENFVVEVAQGHKDIGKISSYLMGCI